MKALIARDKVENTKIKGIAIVVIFIYVVTSYQVLIDSVISVNTASFFYKLSNTPFFAPGYALGMFLGLIGGNVRKNTE